MEADIKQVVILYRNEENNSAINFIKKDFEEVFGQYISFTNYYLSQLDAHTILNADAFLVIDESLLQDVKTIVRDFTRIIKINRSPARESLGMISSIPAGSNVLLVNDSYESSLATVYSFYEIGVSHINLIPYDSALFHTGIYDHIKIAITPSEPHLVPSYIEQTIDIGYRKVSFDTMFKLMQLLDLDVGVINWNLLRHIHSVVESNEGFHSNYIYGYLKSEMLSHMINASENGMLLTDISFQPVYANGQALKIFHTDNKNHIRINDYIRPELLSSQEKSDELILIGDDAYSFESNPIYLMNDVIGYYIILRDSITALSQSRLIKRSGFTAKYCFKDIIYESKAIEKVLDTAKQIATTDETVFITGESGTGKELFAQAIHNASPRKNGPFIAINCAALPDTLLESELFGYESGAFTGANSRGKKGLLEQAIHGTVFLDEIGEVSPKFQASFLRVIQERQIIHVGGKELINIDVRFITATNKNLPQKVKEGCFRNDLFFRLNVFPLSIPPLCRRKEDISALLKYFLLEDCRSITKEDFSFLENYGWPGNVRELENVCTFYKTMHRFPDYLLSSSLGENTYVLKTNTSNNSLVVLKLIDENTELSHGIGRSNLIYQLKGRGYYFSDNHLRRILDKLKADSLITVKSGRCGAQITEKGSALLHKNRI